LDQYLPLIFFSFHFFFFEHLEVSCFKKIVSGNVEISVGVNLNTYRIIHNHNKLYIQFAFSQFSGAYLIIHDGIIEIVFYLGEHSAEIHGLWNNGGVARSNGIIYRKCKEAINIFPAN